MGDLIKLVSSICCVLVVGTIFGISLGVWVDQCQLGNGDSLHVKVDSVKLTTAPTDNVFLGWESLFGKPSDEISVNLQSSFCVNRNPPAEITEGQTINFGSSLTINTFYRNGFSFWLEEDDGGFEGADDYSQITEVPSRQLHTIRQTFDNGAADYIELDYAVVVEGKNIFQENTWFGFIAENLCVSALDFVMGPWGSKAVKNAVRFNSGAMAKLYNKIKLQHMLGTLTKKSLFKSVATYQLREGSKAVRESLKGIPQGIAQDVITEWALDQTLLDEKIRDTVTVLVEDGVYTATGEDGLDIYSAVNNELATWGGYLATLTDSLEFCLVDVLPPSRDAVYHVNMTVTR